MSACVANCNTPQHRPPKLDPLDQRGPTHTARLAYNDEPAPLFSGLLLAGRSRGSDPAVRKQVLTLVARLCSPLLHPPHTVLANTMHSRPGYHALPSFRNCTLVFFISVYLLRRVGLSCPLGSKRTSQNTNGRHEIKVTCNGWAGCGDGTVTAEAEAWIAPCRHSRLNRYSPLRS